ncbi:MAG: hypothetical protein AMXMBFR48_21130 [Ignavibacteriales bacterium]
MKKILLSVLILALGTFLILNLLIGKNEFQNNLPELKEKYARKEKTAADHSKFTQLQKDFTRPQDVTAACITCHNERHTEVMKTSHWNWERTEYIPGKGIKRVGKKNILNNFCIGIAGNETSCNKCHIGYGWDDPDFDFTDPTNVDCLACHDNSNEYMKQSGGAGMPDPSVNLAFVAQRVGKPQRTNCGTCHFLGGGGNNVKHGDLETELFSTTRAVDVHMGTDGSDLNCIDCHTAENHQMKGKVFSLSSMNKDRSECETCHSNLPHENSVLNEHTQKVACQTCHIPLYAKVNPTKMTWDWSTAGKLKDGQPFTEFDSLGKESYTSLKGNFTWARNVEPEYIWFNGTASHYLLGDTMNPDETLQLNRLYGSYEDPAAKIIPVKIHRSKQIYDRDYKYLIQPKTVSNYAGDGGFWGEFDWNRAAEEGMKQIHLPYSGSYDFVKTEMTWPLNHMVAPKEQSLACADCHTRENSRLASLTDFYLPGRDYSPAVDTLGAGVIFFTALGIVTHAIARFMKWKKKKEQGKEDDAKSEEQNNDKR